MTQIYAIRVERDREEDSFFCRNLENTLEKIEEILVDNCHFDRDISGLKVGEDINLSNLKIYYTIEDLI